MLGNVLRERDQQYVANRDDTTNTWRILDSWHDALRELDVDDDIPDDSAAITILTEGAFIALVKEAARLGVLQNSQVGSSEEDEELLGNAEMQIESLTRELEDARREVKTTKIQPPSSEQFKLKELALLTVLKLTALSEVEMLTSKDI